MAEKHQNIEEDLTTKENGQGDGESPIENLVTSDSPEKSVVEGNIAKSEVGTCSAEMSSKADNIFINIVDSQALHRFPKLSIDPPDEEAKDDINQTKEDSPLTLLTLPSEMLLHICSFLDAYFILNTLRKVCVALETIVNDNVFWKVRMGKRWPGYKYPALPGKL